MGGKRWPCLLSIRTIMSDDGGETEGGRGEERGRATDRGERDGGMEAWRNERF